LYTYLDKNNLRVKSKSTFILHPDIIKDFRILYLKGLLASFFRKQNATAGVSFIRNKNSNIQLLRSQLTTKLLNKKKVLSKNYRIRR
jgi:hypothetical protein